MNVKKQKLLEAGDAFREWASITGGVFWQLLPQDVAQEGWVPWKIWLNRALL